MGKEKQIEEMAKITYDNAVRFFGLDKEITDEK